MPLATEDLQEIGQGELLEKLILQLDRRFEQVDKRFEQVDKRFEQVDKRFDAMQKQMDKRFDSMQKRIDRFMIWSFGLYVTMTGLIVTIIKYT